MRFIDKLKQTFDLSPKMVDEKSFAEQTELQTTIRNLGGWAVEPAGFKFYSGSNSLKILKSPLLKIVVNDGTNDIVEVGELDAGTFGFRTTAGTITGGTIRTAASGARVQLDSTNYLRGYNATLLQMQLQPGSLKFYDSAGDEAFDLYTGAGGWWIERGENRYVLFAGPDGNVIYTCTGTVAALLYSENWLIYNDFDPAGYGSQDQGDAERYWNVVNAKAFTDRSGVFKTTPSESYNLIKNIKAEKDKGHCRKLEDRGHKRIKFSELPDYMWDNAMETAKEDIIYDKNIIIDNQIGYEKFKKGDVIAKKGEKTRWRIAKQHPNKDDGKKHIIEAAEGLELTAMISHLIGCNQRLIEEVEKLKVEINK